MKKVLLILVALCICAMPALADTQYWFNVTGPAVDGGFTGNNNWTLSASPTPGTYGSGGSFTMFNVSTDLGNDQITFYNAAAGGLISDSFGLNIFGAQVYTGDESAPTFVLGTYTGSQNNDGLGAYTLTISDTPEPGSLFLLGSGLVGLGGTLRRKFLA